MKFKVGDRVAVYENCKRFTGMVLNDGHQSIQVELDDDRVLPFHPKQCRRLIKKPRRRVWIYQDDIGDERISCDSITFDHKSQLDCMPLVEKKQMDRIPRSAKGEKGMSDEFNSAIARAEKNLDQMKWGHNYDEWKTLKAENERLRILLRDIRFHLPDVLDYRQFQETVAEDLSARIDAILSDKGAGNVP